MATRQLLTLVVGVEAMLVLMAALWMWLRDIPASLGAGSWLGDTLRGAVVAGGLAAVNFYLLCYAPELPGARAVRRLYRDTLKPLFGTIGRREVLVISVAAGIGEELLFRGALQPEVGLVPASLIFGVLHMGGNGTFAFSCWVAVMGGVLGGLALWTEGLLAPIIAHTVYDATALAYMRWGLSVRPVGSLLDAGVNKAPGNR